MNSHSSGRLIGIIKSFNNGKGKGAGYGFIARADGEPDVFVHISKLACATETKELWAGDEVSFVLGPAHNGRQQAVDVIVNLRAEQPRPGRRHD